MKYILILKEGTPSSQTSLLQIQNQNFSVNLAFFKFINVFFYVFILGYC